MMKFYKILTVSFFIFFFGHLTFSYDDSIQIISRKDWGANEEYRYKDSAEWKAIFAKWASQTWAELTEAQKQAQEAAKKKENAINAYLVKNYPLENALVQTISSENGRPLVWSIQKETVVKGIVIHHTETETKTSLDWIQAIYKYHALTHGRWDIGYNYVIGYDGEIFEGRAGWDYVVGAHAIYNNRATIGISVMGNMQNHDITDKQLLSLQKLILFLSKKYGINLNKNVEFHKECKGTSCSSPMTSFSNAPLLWHRDVWYTSCPWEYLYKRLPDLITYLAPDTKGYTTIKNSSTSSTASQTSSLAKYSTDKLLTLLSEIEHAIDTTTIATKKTKLQLVEKIILSELKTRTEPTGKVIGDSFEDTHMIKIKLSYPSTWSIDITNGKETHSIIASWTGISVDGFFSPSYTLSSWSGGYITVLSWNRYQDWDTKKQYNDNVFRWNMIVYQKNGSLVVVNEIKLSDYLAWLWEVSEGTNEEKARTIIISARTYARYYMEKAKKFPWELYDGSDNPNEFQRYLWYGLEKRSPTLLKVVNETKNLYITYEWNIIKPWYFNSSNGKTLSFYNYCLQSKNKISFCSDEAKKYPYLQSVTDYGSIGKTLSWHGVWISWGGASYFAEKWWSAEMIISYFLKGVKLSYF